MRHNALEIHARERLGLSDEWSARKFERIEDQAFMVEMSAPTGVYKSGPRNGEPKYGTDGRRKFVIGIEEHHAWWESWCKDHDVCPKCSGDGQLFVSWNKDTGTKTRDCPRCGATGKWAEKPASVEAPE